MLWVMQKCVQVLCTILLRTNSRSTSTWAFYLPLFGTLVNLGLLYWKRHNVPLNYVLLSTFTLLEAFTLGIMTAFFENEIVLQAV